MPGKQLIVFLALSALRSRGAKTCQMRQKSVTHQVVIVYTNLTFIAAAVFLDDCVVNLHFMLIFCQVSPPSCFPWLISPVTGPSHDMSPTFVTMSRVTWSGHFVTRSMTAAMIDTL